MWTTLLSSFSWTFLPLVLLCHHRWRREKERKEQKMEGDPSFSPYKPVYWTGKQHRYAFVYFLHLKRVFDRLLARLWFKVCVHFMGFFRLFVCLLQRGNISASVRNSLSDDFSSVFSVRPDRNCSDASSCWMRWYIFIFALRISFFFFKLRNRKVNHQLLFPKRSIVNKRFAVWQITSTLNQWL